MRKEQGRKDIMLYEYHKGGLCIHKMMMCQEGYCSECYIHKAESHLKKIDALNLKAPAKASRPRVLVSASK